MYILYTSFHNQLSVYNPNCLYIVISVSSNNVAVCKTSYIDSIARFMKLVRQRNNPNKKTVIYILYILFHQQLSIYNQDCLGISVVLSCNSLESVDSVQ